MQWPQRHYTIPIMPQHQPLIIWRDQEGYVTRPKYSIFKFDLYDDYEATNVQSNLELVNTLTQQMGTILTL